MACLLVRRAISRYDTRRRVRRAAVALRQPAVAHSASRRSHTTGGPNSVSNLPRALENRVAGPRGQPEAELLEPIQRGRESLQQADSFGVE
jgi:hypothetical protein